MSLATSRVSCAKSNARVDGRCPILVGISWNPLSCGGFAHRAIKPGPMAGAARASVPGAGEDAASLQALRKELKQFIVGHLRLHDVDPSELDDDAPLVGSGLDLDSIDVLELVTGVEKKYGVRFEDPELVQRVFTSVSTIASHLAALRGPPSAR